MCVRYERLCEDPHTQRTHELWARILTTPNWSNGLFRLGAIDECAHTHTHTRARPDCVVSNYKYCSRPNNKSHKSCEGGLLCWH